VTNILDPTFRYTPSHKTDIRKTMRREQRRLARLAEREAQNQAEAARVVRPMARRKP